MPTAPWMKGPLLLPPDNTLDVKKKKSADIDYLYEKTDRALTDKISGRRGKQVMKKIVQSITKLQARRDFEEPQAAKPMKLRGLEVPQREIERIEFGVQLEEEGGVKAGAKMPWAKAERIVFRRMKKERVVTKAELVLPESVLARLRSDAAKMRLWVKAKKAGVTQGVVDEIKMTWRSNELAMVKFCLPLCRNMDRAREILEVKTGGLVVWSNKDSHVVYKHRKYGSKTSQASDSGGTRVEEASSLTSDFVKVADNVATSNTTSLTNTEVVDSVVSHVDERFDLPSVCGTLYEREADRLLDGLGPRFIDWWRPKPLPVDADMLSEVIPGFKTPFRRCPPHVNPKLTDDELTYMRKLARPLPTHFALGRNTKLHGLAAAIIKLWEKSHIVKIAVKCGIPNTNSEQMAWELKRLTGGVLILRNKFFIILYRGKDFLPSEVANLIVEREFELKRNQILEEAARWKSMESFSLAQDKFSTTNSSGTYSEFQDFQTKYGIQDGMGEINIQMEADKEKLKKEIRNQEHKLMLLKRKIERSARELSKLNSAWKIAEKDVDQELITEEERICLQKMGLKTSKTLLLGRRGVFDGVIGSIHQHWKHREIVKVITMQRSFSQIMNTAALLEIESGGILVTIEKLRKGHTIILYRGKNYRRPLKLLPDNLLSKRAALQRSLLMQKIGSLKFFAHQRQRTISNLQAKLRSLSRKFEEVSESANS